MSLSLSDHAAWRAVQQRDQRYDGRFVYAVSSTMVYCRPSCSSRRPSRANVAFYASPAAAEQAGFRACKRCRPAQTPAIERAVAEAREYIEQHVAEAVTLATLSARVGVSAFHLQRAFKRAVGVSPRQYRDACRRRLLSQRLKAGDSVSRATFEAGFGSSSRVYERSLGMTPATVRRGGDGQRMQFSIVRSPLGRLLVAYTERGVCSVAIGESDEQLERGLRRDFPNADVRVAGSSIHEWITAIVASIETGTSTHVPIDARGTAFQWRVWNALQAIPRGTTLSYSEVAKKIGRASAVRAVARACATNPVALVIPCHRVIREDGGLGGYRWGLERKRALLEREGGAGRG